jgi:DNA recombination protein RmuC
MADKVGQVGTSLEGSMKKYNEMVASMEARVLPAARRFKELGAGEANVEIAALEPTETAPRLPAPAPAELELTPPPRVGKKR